MQDLQTLKNNFFGHMQDIMKKEKCASFQDLFKIRNKEANDVYYFNRGEPLFKYGHNKDTITLIDQRDKIEIILDQEAKKQFLSLAKRYEIKGEKSQQNQQSIDRILYDLFTQGHFQTINDKPYLVYDIETDISDNIKQTEFWIAYAMQPKNNTVEYTYVDKANLKEFAQYMIDFDGYIIGFNNIFFDNPVTLYNAWLGEEEIKLINQKSIDLFTFVSNMTGKRMGLNKIASALVGIEKTQESWAQAGNLYKKYLETGDEKLLNEFKDYCKNDVKMTALVLRYMLHYQKIYIDGEEISYTVDQLVKESTNEKKQPETIQNSSIF